MMSSFFVQAVRRFDRGDLALVVTNPPLLPFAIAAACRIRGARCLLLVHDVYPEALVAAGVVDRRSTLVRIMTAASRWLWSNADRVVVVGRDMQALIWRRIGRASPRVVMIPNWADTEEVVVRSRATNLLLRELGLEQRFVVEFAGNIGRVQGVADLVDAAASLREHDDVRFLIIGSGARKTWLEREARDRGLRNVTILPGRPRTDQTNFLNACDVAIIPLVRGMVGVGMPSRLYNALAAGKPVIAVAEGPSELATVILEERIGWVVPPGSPQQIAAAVLEAQVILDGWRRWVVVLAPPPSGSTPTL